MSSIIDVVIQSIRAIVVVLQPSFHPFLKFSDVAEHTQSPRDPYNMCSAFPTVRCGLIIVEYLCIIL